MIVNPDNKADPRNMIKNCPHCGEIWIKVEGCDGTTSCGNRKWSKGMWDTFASGHMSQYFKYSFKF